MKMHVVRKHVTFKNKTNVEIQIVSEDATKPHKYICTICDRRFDKDILLQSHIKRHTTDYQCKDCGRRCKTLSSLRNHAMIHNKLFPFKCEHCAKPFRNAVKLKLHVRLHTGERPYKCEMCDVAFARLEKLKLHKYEHVKSILINGMKTKYVQIKAKNSNPVLPSPLEVARSIVAETDSEGPKIELKCVNKVKDESDEDEEIDEEDLIDDEETIVELEGIESFNENELIEEIEVDNSRNGDLYEVVLQDENGFIVEEGDIEMNYILEEECLEEAVNVQQ